MGSSAGLRKTQQDRIVHASAVALAGRAVLICGASGSGKSALALELISRGCGLIADDRTVLRLQDGVPVAACPPAIRGRIEARGVGILAVSPARPAPVGLIVDLDLAPEGRLPPPARRPLCGVAVPLVAGKDVPGLAAAIHVWLTGGRVE